MADYVPDYLMEDDPIPSSSGFCHPNSKNNNEEEEGLVEIFWSRGQVEERSLLKKLKTFNTTESAVTSVAHQQQPELFIQEDEMASWLHLPLEDEDRFGGSDLVYPSPAAPAPAVNYAATASTSSQSNRGGAVAQIGENRPPIPPKSGSNFSFFNPLRRLSGGRGEAARESGVVEANRVGLGQRLESDGGGVNLVGRNAHLNAAEQETFTLDLTAVASSSGGVSSEKEVKNDQKRKSRADEEEDHGEEGVDTKKRARGSSSARRSRAAEVHNLSERKRRDRINERMKALQELIPRSNKSDKASMLDDAIEYLKHLQLQVQVMSMGCGMVPMVFAGGQQFMVPMDMGLSRPIMPFPQVAGSSMPRPVAAAHLDPRHTIPAYHPPTGSDPLLSHYGIRGVNPMPVPFADYQRYFSQYNVQAPPYPPSETRTTAGASTSKVRSGENQKVEIRKLD